MVRAVYRLALRQAEGLVAPIITLLRPALFTNIQNAIVVFSAGAPKAGERRRARLPRTT
jgi:hypothetical protein